MTSEDTRPTASGASEPGGFADADEARLLEQADALLAAHGRGSGAPLASGGAFVDAGPEREAVDGLDAGAKLGRFVILERAGAGGMGVVYAAYDPQLDRRIALKLLRPGQIHEDRSDRGGRLLREARALARLSHPNVVPIHDVLEVDGRLVMATELVEGRDLLAWLRAEPRSREEILAVHLQAARGLDAAHGAGIVHRDFKPANVLVGEDGRVRVTDFGLALAADEASTADPGSTEGRPGTGDDPLGYRATRTGAQWGTPGFIAPEVLRGEPATPAIDQYAFCVSLATALTDRPPSDLSDLTGEDAEPGSPLDLPPWLRTLLRRGLDPEPAARYPSMSALVDALELGPPVSGRRSLLLPGAALLLLGFLAWALIPRSAKETLPTPIDPRTRGRILVGPFEDATGDPELSWIGRGLRQMVAETLDEVEGIDSIDWSRIEAQSLWKPPDGASAEAAPKLDATTIDRLLAAVAAELLVTTRFQPNDDGGLLIRYRTRAVTGAEGEREFVAADAFGAADTLVARLTRRLRPEAAFPSLSDRFSESPFVNRLLALGLDARSRRGYSRALPLFEAAVELDPTVDRARLWVASSLSFAGRSEEAVRIAEDILERSTDLEDRTLSAAALEILGIEAETSGDFAEGREFLEESVRLMEEAGDQEMQGKVLLHIGRLHDAEAEAAEAAFAPQETLDELNRLAIDPYERGIRLLEGLPDPGSRLLAAYTAGLVAKSRRSWPEAEREFRRSLTLARRHGYLQDQARALNTLAQVVFEQGRVEESRAYLLESIETHRRAEHWWGVAATTGNLGERLLAEEDWAGAVEAWERSVEAASRFGDAVWTLSRAWTGLGHAYLGMGDGERALDAFEKARDVLDLDSPELEALIEESRALIASSAAESAA